MLFIEQISIYSKNQVVNIRVCNVTVERGKACGWVRETLCG